MVPECCRVRDHHGQEHDAETVAESLHIESITMRQRERERAGKRESEC